MLKANISKWILNYPIHYLDIQISNAVDANTPIIQLLGGWFSKIIFATPKNRSYNRSLYRNIRMCPT